MKKNMRTADRAIRLVLGLIIVLAWYYFDMNYWVMGVGAFFVITGLLSWCPVYVALGICSCKNCEKCVDDKKLTGESDNHTDSIIEERKDSNKEEIRGGVLVEPESSDEDKKIMTNGNNKEITQDQKKDM